MKCDDRQTGTEISVTEEMEKAGREIYYDLDPEELGLGEVVARLFRAMDAVRRRI
ncbi:hypothetical protein [Marinovum sp. B10]|uniref:hypothetical protein n=1 Tax=Marinovum sp. B10 TaxID=3449224 RepID=UPI003EDB6FDD